MKPFLGVVGTAYVTFMCLMGIFFMLFLGLGYKVAYQQLVVGMKEAEISQAAFSCFIASGIYVVLSGVMLWQCYLHWSVGRTARMASNSPISLKDMTPKENRPLVAEQNKKNI